MNITTGTLGVLIYIEDRRRIIVIGNILQTHGFEEKLSQITEAAKVSL